MLLLIKAAGHSRSFSFIFSQRYYSQESLTLPIGTYQGLKIVSKQIGIKYGQRIHLRVTWSRQTLVAYGNQGKK